jgi:hypothetical protein
MQICMNVSSIVNWLYFFMIKGRLMVCRHTGSLKCQNRLEQTCDFFLQSSHRPNVILACNL